MTNLKPFVLRLPRKIVFGEGSATGIADYSKEFNAKSALLVTDPVLRKIGILDRALSPLAETGIDIVVFDGAEPEPSIQVAESAAMAGRARRYDLVIGLGGGSALDMAKIASVAATNPENVSSFIGVEKVPRPGLPKLLLPTTAGTGSEVTMNAVVSSQDDSIKTGIVSSHLLADTAVVDPALTLTMPPGLTAATGLDALTHAVESVMSLDSNPLTEALALRAVQLIFTSLRRAYEKGDDMEARRNMSLASLSAAMAFGTSGVCGGHAAAYAFAVKYRCAHGVSCALALPYVMEFNAPACIPALAKVAQAAGAADPDPERAAFEAVAAVRRLIRELGLPLSLKEIGVEKEKIPALARDMLKSTRVLARNPRPITEKDAEELFTRIHRGEPLPFPLSKHL